MVAETTEVYPVAETTTGGHYGAEFRWLRNVGYGAVLLRKRVRKVSARARQDVGPEAHRVMTRPEVRHHQHAGSGGGEGTRDIHGFLDGRGGASRTPPHPHHEFFNFIDTPCTASGTISGQSEWGRGAPRGSKLWRRRRNRRPRAANWAPPIRRAGFVSNIIPQGGAGG